MTYLLIGITIIIGYLKLNIKTLKLNIMIKIFRKNIEKEFWKQIKLADASQVFVDNYNPFSGSLAEYKKHKIILSEKKKWFKENLDKIETFIPTEQAEEFKNTILLDE